VGLLSSGFDQVVRVTRTYSRRTDEPGIKLPREVRRDSLQAMLHLEGPLRPPRGAALREDLDDAVRCLRPVQRGRGRTLDHLHPLDVVRDDVEQSGRGLAGNVRTTVARDVDPHAV